MKQYDFVLENGRVIDPKNERDEIACVAVRDGKIAAVAPELPAQDAETVYDVSGLMVTPGLIDTHVHLFYQGPIHGAVGGDRSLHPDYFNFPSGVTTLVDAGSAGSSNFDDFRAGIIDRAKSRIYALLNTTDAGMASYEGEQFPEKNSVERFVSCWEKHKDIIKGIKVAHYWMPDWGQIEGAQRVQKYCGLPIMVDFGHFRKERPFSRLVEEKLNPGDIATHCFRAPVPVVDETGKVYDYLVRARARGIWFDLGHGAESFVFRNAVPAMRQGFLPDTFSTDLHGGNIHGTVQSEASVLSKMLACCDMPYLELFRRMTSNPAEMLHLEDAGNLDIGAEADIAVWSVREGSFGFLDAVRGRLTGNRLLECEMTFRKGEIVWDKNARAATDYETLSAWYGIHAPDERVIPE